jgi:hypothetical protein
VTSASPACAGRAGATADSPAQEGARGGPFDGYHVRQVRLARRFTPKREGKNGVMAAVRRLTLLTLSLAAVLIPLGCGGGDDDEGDEGYPAEVVSNFMASCEPSARRVRSLLRKLERCVAV